jgi:hypothetical protein
MDDAVGPTQPFSVDGRDTFDCKEIPVFRRVHDLQWRPPASAGLHFEGPVKFTIGKYIRPSVKIFRGVKRHP